MKVNKYFVWFLFASALFIAGNAAYFSVKGIALLFAGSFTSVAIMATSLEIGKLFAASFLYRFWKESTKSLRLYLSIALLGLIGITSLGIYGYLANAFEYTRSRVELYENNIQQLNNNNKYVKEEIQKLEQSTDTTDVKIDDAIAGFERIYNEYVTQQETNKNDSKEKFERINTEIESKRLVLNDRTTTLDDIIAEINSKGGLFSNRTKKLKEERERQAPEREKISMSLTILDKQDADNITQYNNILEVTQDSIATEYQKFLSKVDGLRKTTNDNESTVQVQMEGLYEKVKNNDEQILSVQGNIRDTDIGTFRFVARAFNMEVDTAVKWFTLAIVCVFDPLSICLIIGFNMAHVKLYGNGLVNEPGTIRENYTSARKAMKEEIKKELKSL
tara:strand:+ start:257 stop:1426 length:1170 start_codon:yes stop_codon:yes gene_type:complete